jgi:hypothetical protein
LKKGIDMKVRVLTSFTAFLIVSAGLIGAQTVGRGPESIPTEGRATSSELYPAAISFDREWTARGFNIEDANRNIVFSWDDIGAISRESMTNIWSPDSTRVVFLEQHWKGPMFYCAELEGGTWRNVPVHLYQIGDRRTTDPKAPKLSIVTHAEILQWVSPTILQVKMNVGYVDPPSHSRKEVEYLTTLEFNNGEAYFAQ